MNLIRLCHFDGTRGASSVEFSEFRDDPFITFKKGYRIRALTDRLCGRAGFEPMISFESDARFTRLELRHGRRVLAVDRFEVDILTWADRHTAPAVLLSVDRGSFPRVLMGGVNGYSVSMTTQAWVWVGICAVLIGATALFARWMTERDRRRAAWGDSLLDPETADDPERGRPRPWIIVNPTKQEDPEAFRAEVDRLAAERGIPHVHWIDTSREDPGTGQALHALDLGASVVIAAGGDGTVRAVAAAMAHSGTRMGILPLGTGNLLARNLGLPLDDLGAALDAVFGPDHRAIDLAWLRVEGIDEAADQPAEGALLAASNASLIRTLPTGAKEPREDEFAFVVIAGLGFDGETMARTDPKLKRAVGWPAYVISAFGAMKGRRMRSQLTLIADTDTPADADTGLSEFTARSVLFANCGELPYIVLAPEASLDDGMLDIVAVDTQAGLIGWLDLAGRILVQGMGIKASTIPTTTANVAFRQAPAASLSVDLARPVQVDGDLVATARTVHVRTDPGALDVAVAMPPVL